MFEISRVIASVGKESALEIFLCCFTIFVF